MKKTAITLKGKINLRNWFCLLVLLFTVFLQSCSEEEMVQNQIAGSIDRNRQTYSGPSYPNSSSDKSLSSFNISALASGGIMPNKPNHASGTFNAPGTGSFENSYANNSHGPSTFYNNTENNNERIAMTYKDEATPGFMNHLEWMGGIEFVQKKSKDGDTKITLNYLEVPLYILYQSTPSSTGNIFGGLGPYFAYGIGGKIKSNYNGQTSATKSFDKNTGFKPFDAGLNLMAGYKVTNSFSFSLNYNYGLANIDRNPSGDKAKNRCISLNIGYPLNKLIKK